MCYQLIKFAMQFKVPLAESSENDYNALLSLCMPADESGEMFYYQDILEYGFRVLQTANRDMNYSSYVN